MDGEDVGMDGMEADKDVARWPREDGGRVLDGLLLLVEASPPPSAPPLLLLASPPLTDRFESFLVKRIAILMEK